MYFWKTKQLAAFIKDAGLTENIRKNYYLATSILMLISIYLIALSPPKNYYAIIVEAVSALAITIIGIKTTFSANNGEKGSDYVGRMIVLSLPLVIKILVIGFLFGLIVGVYIGISGNSDVESWATMILSISLQAWFFWRLNIHLKCINA
ncbi:MAG: hypothetical protein LWW98_08070 [Deltaproteobacteria bacterium]|nr:hypothetical protein [Deltaproteobacteria bacterium]